MSFRVLTLLKLVFIESKYEKQSLLAFLLKKPKKAPAMRLKTCFILAVSLAPPLHGLGQEIATAFPLKWKAPIGQVSYRTQPALVQGKLFVGSNGNHFNDYLLDSGNGVHVLDAKSGKSLGVLGTDTWGDLDVNGVLAVGDRIFFGNDNDEFLCYSAKDLKLLWRIPTSGDCEHAPTLLRRKDGDQVIVFATEIGEIRAVRPSNGATVWVHYDRNFEGWKPGKTPFVYRVASSFQTGTTFFDAPHVSDLSGDGVFDFVYFDFDAVSVISGQTGTEILYKDNPPGVHYNNYSSPTVIQTPQGACLFQSGTHFQKGTSFLARTLLPSGKQLTPIELQKDTRLDAFPSPLAAQSGILLLNPNGNFRLHGSNNTSIPVGGRASETPSGQGFLGRDSFTYKGKPVLVHIQEYVYGSKLSRLTLLSGSDLSIVADYSLPTRCESKPHLLDVDADGHLELLYGCSDGYLYCHEIPTP